MAIGEDTRAQYLSALANQRRTLNQSGNQLVNPSVNNLAGLTSVDTSFSGANTMVGRTVAEQVSDNESYRSRNGWERFIDTVNQFTQNIFNGIIDFVDNVGDFFIGAAGTVGKWFGQDDQWALDAMAHPWDTQVKQINNALNRSINSVFTSDLWTPEGREDLGKQWTAVLSPEESARQLSYQESRSYGSDMGSFGTGARGVFTSIGTMLPSIALAVVTGGATSSTLATQAVQLGSMGISAAGGQTEKAASEGASIDKAFYSGLASGTIEVLSEKLVGKALGKAAKALHLDSIADSFGKIGGVAVSKNLVAKSTAKDIAVSMFEEGAEEVFSELLSPFVDAVYKGDKAFVDENGKSIWLSGEKWKDVGSAFLAGAASGGIMDGVSTSIQYSKYGKVGISINQNFNKLNELRTEYNRAKINNQDTTQIENQTKAVVEQIQSEMETAINNPKDKAKLQNLFNDYFNNSVQTDADFTKAVEQFKADLSRPSYQVFTDTLNEQFKNANTNLNIRWASEGEMANYTTNNEYNALQNSDNSNIRGYINKKTGEIVFNEKYKNEVGSLVKHEAISHGILDTDSGVRNSVIEYIKKNKELAKEYEELQKKVEKTYETKDKSLIESETLASFLESKLNDYDALRQMLTPNSLIKSKALALLRNIKNKLKKTNNIDNVIYNKVNKIINEINKTATKARVETAKLKQAVAYSKENKNIGKLKENENIYGTSTTIKEAKNILKQDIKNIFYENNIDSNIVGLDIIGSRRWGYYKSNSDIDVVLEYDGNIKEDTMFNILKENKIKIDGIDVDINPINAKYSQTLQEHIRKDDIYSSNKINNLSYSKVVNNAEEGKATGVDVNADIIKNASQSFQNRFINLNSVEDIYQAMKDGANSLFKNVNVEFTGKEKKARQTFVDFNTLLNKPDKLNTELENVINDFLDSQISYDFKLEDNVVVPQTSVLRNLMQDMGIDTQTFFKDSVNQLKEALNTKSKPSRLLKIKQFYQDRVKTLVNAVNYYRNSAYETIKTLQSYDKISDMLDKNKMAVNKVGDQYVPKLDFYKSLMNGEDGRHRIRLSKSSGGISPVSITNLINNMEKYTKENIETLGGVWTETNDEIRDNLNLLESQMVVDPETKNKVFPNRSLTLEEVSAVRNVLTGIKQEMKELYTEEGIARQQATYKADIELKAIDNGFKKKETTFILERELDYNSSMNSILAKWFGVDSEIHHIFYDNVFTALDNQYLQQERMNTELIDKMKKYNLWDKIANSGKRSVFNKKVNFKGTQISIGTMMDIYAESLTDTGLATLQNGGYSWKNKENGIVHHKVLEANDFKTIEETLTEAQKNFVREVVNDLYNGSWKEYKGNADTKIKGYKDLVNSETYYPVNRSDMTKSDVDAENFGTLDLSNQSFNKRRNQKTNHLAIKGMNFIDRARAYTNGLAKYGEMYSALKQFDMLRNQWTTDNNGKSRVRNAIFKENIPQWNTFIDYLGNQIAGNPQKMVLQSKTFSNLVAATLYGNISVVLKQTASLPTIMLEVSPKAWAKGIMKGATNLAKYKSTKAFIETQSGIAAQRWANFDSVASQTLAKEVSKLGKIFGIPMEKMDEGIIVLFGWTSAQYQAQIEGFGKPNTDTNNQRAIEILNKIIANTQSNSIAMNMSMSRAGTAGYVRKVLSYFSSDLQNKISKLNGILNDAKYAKQRIAGIEKLETQYNEELTKAQTDFDKFVSNANKEDGGYQERYDQLKNVLDQAQEKVDTIKEMKTKELKIINGGERLKEAMKFAIATMLSALMIAGIEELVKRIYGRKGWTENTTQDFLRNWLLEGTIGNLPYAMSIVNSVEYGQDVGGYDFTLINSAIDIVKSISTMIQSGKFNAGALTNLLTTLGQLTGIPTKNLYNLIVGIYKNVSPSGYSAEAIMKGYSDSYISTAYSNAVSSGNTNAAKGYLNLLMGSYKTGTQDDSVNNEITRLKANGYSCMPKNAMKSYTNEQGQEIALTDSQTQTFMNLYGKSTKEVNKLLSNSDYKRATDEEKSKLIKKIYDAYYSGAKAKTLNIDADSKLGTITTTNISIAKYVASLQKISTITESKTKSKKELVVEYVNKLSGYSKQEKLLLMYLAGYSVGEENQKTLLSYLTSNGMTSKEAKAFLKME